MENDQFSVPGNAGGGEVPRGGKPPLGPGVYTLTNIQRGWWDDGAPYVEASFEGPGKLRQRLNPAGYASLIGAIWGDQVVTVEQVGQAIIAGTALEVGLDVQDSSRPTGNGDYYREIVRFMPADTAEQMAKQRQPIPAPQPAPTNQGYSPSPAPASPPPPAPRAGAAPPPPPPPRTRGGGGGPTAPPPPPLRPR